MAMYVAAAWIVLVGAVRKWFAPGISDYLFYTPHLLLLMVYLKIGLPKLLSFKLVPKLFYVLLGIVFVWTLLTAFVSSAFGIVGTTLAMMNYFFFVPLFAVIFYEFRNYNSFMNFVKFSLILCPGILALGFFQYFMPIDHYINKYLVDDKVIAQVVSRPRITGTFSYIAGYGTYLIFMVQMVMIFLISAKKKFAEHILVILVGIGVVINAFMTGSRSVVWVIFIHMGAVVAYLNMKMLKSSFYFMKVIIALIALIFFLYFANTNEQFKEAVANFQARVERGKDIEKRLNDAYLTVRNSERAGLTGYGVGTTSIPLRKRFARDQSKLPDEFEDEPTRLILELGLTGYILIVGWRLMIFIYSGFIFLKIKSHSLKIVGLTMTLFQLEYINQTHLINSVTASFYYWFCIGVVFAIPYWDKAMLAKRNKVSAIL